MSPKIKYCRNKDSSTDRYTCGGTKMNRVYVRENEPIIEKTESYPYKNKILGYKRKFVPIGWICPKCNKVIKD